MNLGTTLQDLINSEDPATRRIGERAASDLQAIERRAAVKAAVATVDAANASGASGTPDGAHDVTDEATGRAMLDRALAPYRGKAKPAAPATKAGDEIDDAAGRAIQDRAIASVRSAR